MTAFRIELPNVQDAVQTAINAQLETAAEEITCGFGHPGPDMSDREIWVDADFEAELPRYISGGHLRDEAGVVKVKALITAIVGSWQDLRDDALDLVGCVEDAIEADSTLDGLVDRAEVRKAEGTGGYLDERRRQYGVTVSVVYECSANS